LIRTTSTVEPEYDTESYDLLAALYDIEADQHSCGHPLSETTSWEADESNKDRSIVYEADAPLRCMACTVAARKQKEFEEAKALDSAQVWQVRATTRVPDAS
jgi:hypothetical protein